MKMVTRYRFYNRATPANRWSDVFGSPGDEVSVIFCALFDSQSICNQVCAVHHYFC